MRIPGVYIPEFAKLSSEDRKSLIRRCEDSDEMRRLYGRITLMTWISVPCAGATTILLGRFVFHWTQGFAWALATLLACGCLAVTRFLLFMGKVRIIRHQVTKESGGQRAD